MTKQEFLTRLKMKLSVLSTDEITDIIDEYSEIIDEKINEGKTEQQAVHDFGNVDELAREILKAYKIDDQFTEKEDWSRQLSSILNDVASFLTRIFGDLFEHMNERGFSNIISTIITAILLCIFLRIPFWIIEVLGDILLSILLPGLLEGLVVGAWNILCDIGYLVFAIGVIVNLIKTGEVSLKKGFHSMKQEDNTPKQIIDADYTEKESSDNHDDSDL